MSIDSGVFDPWGCQIRGFPLTRRIALTTVLHYRADCDHNKLTSNTTHTYTHRTYCAVNTPMLILRRAEVWEAHLSSGAVARCDVAQCRPTRPILFCSRLAASRLPHTNTAVQCIYHMQPCSYKKRVQQGRGSHIRRRSQCCTNFFGGKRLYRLYGDLKWSSCSCQCSLQKCKTTKYKTSSTTLIS